LFLLAAKAGWVVFIQQDKHDAKNLSETHIAIVNATNLTMK
jgi:hypothetical protein